MIGAVPGADLHGRHHRALRGRGQRLLRHPAGRRSCPTSVTRTWHTQLGRALDRDGVAGDRPVHRAAVCGHEPKFQRLGVNVLFWACSSSWSARSPASGSASLQQLRRRRELLVRPPGLRIHRSRPLLADLLFVGLLLWLILLGRAHAGRRCKKPGEPQPDRLVFLSARCIGGCSTAPALDWGQHTQFRWSSTGAGGWSTCGSKAFSKSSPPPSSPSSSRAGPGARCMAATRGTARDDRFLSGGMLGTLHHLYFTGTPTSVIALGAVFSRARSRAADCSSASKPADLQRSQATPWCRPTGGRSFSSSPSRFWNMVGAGLFGFMINPPLALYYMQGLNTTPLHGHAALFGVYGMLGIGLMLFCLRGLSDRARWTPTGLLKPAFWCLNIGLAMMVFLSLLPAGMYQAWASVTPGLWYARSAEIIHWPRHGDPGLDASAGRHRVRRRRSPVGVLRGPSAARSGAASWAADLDSACPSATMKRVTPNGSWDGEHATSGGWKAWLCPVATRLPAVLSARQHVRRAVHRTVGDAGVSPVGCRRPIFRGRCGMRTRCCSARARRDRGYPLTAGRSWSAQPTPVGLPLAALAALWVAGRILVLTPFAWTAAVVNAAFPLACAVALAMPFMAARNRRNYFFIGLLLLLSGAAFAFHLSALGVIQTPSSVGFQVALDVLLFIMAVMSGRVIPMFTNNGIPGADATRRPWSRRPRLDPCSSCSLPTAWVCRRSSWPPSPSLQRSRISCVGCCGSRGKRWTTHWFSCCMAYAWIPVHLGLRVGHAWLAVAVFATHALTVGAAGGLIIGMMVRTARGHTGPNPARRPDRYRLLRAGLARRAACG